MAYQLGSCTFGIILLLATLCFKKAPFTHGGKLDTEAKLQLQKSFLKSMSSDSCNGEKVQVKKMVKSMEAFEKKCRIKGKDEVSTACCLAEFGYIKTPTEPYDDPKKVVQNLNKGGWYGDSTNKKIAKEIYSQNCHKQFADKDKAEEGVKCLLNAILKCTYNLHRSAAIRIGITLATVST